VNPSAARSARGVHRQAQWIARLIPESEAVVAGGAPVDRFLSRLFKDHRELGSRDRRLLSDAVFAWFRWHGWLHALEGPPRAARWAAAYYLDAVERHPAIDALLANAGLDPALFEPGGGRPCAEKTRLVAGWFPEGRHPLITEVIPTAWAKALYVPAGSDRDRHQARCAEAFQQRPPLWLRANPGSGGRLLDQLARAGYPARIHPRLADAVAVDQAVPSSFLQRSAKWVAVQDLASQCVGAVCDPQGGQRWRDVCAGAGGKSLHLAVLMRNRGRILAEDVRPAALRELERRSRAAGLSIISTRPVNDPPAHRRSAEPADGILVDAPCSGVGTWSRNPDARWRAPMERLPRWAEEQSALLEQAATGLRPGGRLVYAVCTLTRRETLDVTDAFQARHPDFRLDPGPHPLTGIMTDGTYWVWPWDGPCDGMFITRLRRIQ
jgi:16S rRNA (cytosine967-C5)-methyltransferase